MAEDDETTLALSFRDELRAHLLSAATALDYISLSPFYDRACTNQLLLMQNTPPEKLAELLPLYTGKQYVVDEGSDKSGSGRLVSVRRVWRTSSSDASTSALYYAIDGTLYAAPTLAAVLRARMQRALSHVHAALRTLQRFTTFSVLDSYQWNAKLADPEAEEEEKEKEKEEAVKSEDLQDQDQEDKDKVENSAVATLARARYFGRERTVALNLLDELKRHRETHASNAQPLKRARGAGALGGGGGGALALGGGGEGSEASGRPAKRARTEPDLRQ